MKKFTTILIFMLILPSFVFAVSNAKINGQKEVTITSLPVDLVFTCDLAGAGNKIAMEYFVDINGDGQIGPMDPIQDFMYLTDGIGWIYDPADPENDFAGDETGIDGKIRTTFTIEPEEVFIPTGMTGIVRLTDENGSTDIVKINVQLTPQPPFIQGKVTDQTTGSPIANAMVMAENLEDYFIAITDVNGDYQISVVEGTYDVFAMEFPMVNYQPSDTLSVTVTGTTSETQNFQLEPFSCTISGRLTYANGDPVPNIMIMSTGGIGSSFFSMTTSDQNGDYQMGVMPGTVLVGPSFLMNMMNDAWPENHYADPEVDTLNISAGQTLTSNFVFRPYTSFVTGTCTVDGNALPGVSITGVAMDMTTFTMRMYQAVSDQNGDYTMGVMPGTLNMVSAYIEGYSVSSPMSGAYLSVTVGQNETVSDLDFEFSPDGGTTSISGTVTYSDGSPAPNVYVAAENYFEESPEGFLITHTDGSGNFEFANILEGEFHMGVYKDGYSSTPPMRTFYLMYGQSLTGQDYVLSPGTGVDMAENILKPITIRLAQNYPNPFNPTTHINFELPEAENVQILIYNAAGQQIKTLTNSQFSAGKHQVEWNGKDNSGRKVSSGVYFYQLKTNGFNKVMKMILAK